MEIDNFVDSIITNRKVVGQRMDGLKYFELDPTPYCTPKSFVFANLVEYDDNEVVRVTKISFGKLYYFIMCVNNASNLMDVELNYVQIFELFKILANVIHMKDYANLSDFYDVLKENISKIKC